MIGIPSDLSLWDTKSGSKEPMDGSAFPDWLDCAEAVMLPKPRRMTIVVPISCSMVTHESLMLRPASDPTRNLFKAAIDIAEPKFETACASCGARGFAP